MTTQLARQFTIGDDCWLWTGKPTTHGYGQVKIAGRVHRAHRAVYEHFVGAIPDGLESDHLCRVRLCVRPDHLEFVTHAVNVSRQTFRNQHQGRTACLAGHPYAADHGYRRPNGWWYCRTCHRNRQRRLL